MPVNAKTGQGVQAFGMSITLGGFALNVANGWVNRLNAFIAGTLDNRAVSGTGLKSFVTEAYKWLPYSARAKLVVVDGTVNDVRQTSTACLNSIRPALTAIVATAFQGSFRSASHAPGSGITRTGTWTAFGSTYGGRSYSTQFSGLTAMFTTDPSATISYVFNGDKVVIHGYLTDSTVPYRNWNITIDGTPHGVTNFEGQARPGDLAYGGAQLISGLSAGSHTIVLTPTTLSGGYCVLDGFTVPTTSGFGGILLGAVPNIRDWTALGSIGSWADAQQVNAITQDVVDTWKGLGFPVDYADMNEYIDGARDCVADGVHFTDTGHGNYMIGWLDKMRLIA